MFILLCRSYGTQERVITPINKHCVPTGLKRTKVCTSVQKLYTPMDEVTYPCFSMSSVIPYTTPRAGRSDLLVATVLFITTEVVEQVNVGATSWSRLFPSCKSAPLPPMVGGECLKKHARMACSMIHTRGMPKGIHTVDFLIT